ncbi:heparinase II/III family protein [Parabacteroides sp. FAFU027]|uniref:heparinase II/III family protein n=1 Tax=Parabacteroides sp. FAFU027 TaxID=2922715 RepID=UPI001FAEF834|nr:heparinase II/III family protein [Parabacteroides sp. FAFU027]
MKKALISFALFTSIIATSAQQIPLPKLQDSYPRMMTDAKGKGELKNLISKEQWAKDLYSKLQKGIEPYVERHQSDPTWIVSRLQMYWKNHYDTIFINDRVYAYAKGHAPVPTVRYSGARDHVTIYKKPKLEDIKPYMDDERGLWLINGSKPGETFEWADPAQAGKTVEAINTEIMGMAGKAAFFYWYTGDERYAKFAADIFDTYMTGIYYRKEMIDLNHGHQQTLLGLSSFETIQEKLIADVAATYDFLHDYLKAKKSNKIEIYESALKKWADVQIAHGVPFNNWNLMQARFIFDLGMVLNNNKAYPDGKGREYYLDYVLNQSGTRQWALPKLAAYGYDMKTGIWAECPGYSTNVVMSDFVDFTSLLDRSLNIDLPTYLPVLYKAVTAPMQYIFPNRDMSGFGDTGYHPLSPEPVKKMIANAQKNNKPEWEKLFTGLYKLLLANTGEEKAAPKNSVESFFTDKDVKIKENISAAKVEDFITNTFYAPNVSWFVQRNGMDKQNGLMISEYGSKGNHAHANGVAMELYGKGFVQGVESGIGTSYFQRDYAEYYSQFPAHNTVVVDGISSYPVMKSNHAFDLLSAYPASERKSGFYPNISFSNVMFVEPETQADQNRMLSIVRTGETSGYYVDIFRSRKQRGGDRYHDYFYHNLGQDLTLMDNQGKALELNSTEKLCFAEGDLMAYDYLWDKKSVRSAQDFRAQFAIRNKGNDVFMNVWMKGQEGREIFNVKSPATKSFKGASGGLPYDVNKSPLQTLVVRQDGEAWTKPFAAVFEPSSSSAPASVRQISSFDATGVSAGFVGLKVESKSGRTDYIFSSDDLAKTAIYNDMKVSATYSVISTEGNGFTLFMGNGILASKGDFQISALVPATATLEFKNGVYALTADAAITLSTPMSYTEMIGSQNGKETVYKGKAIDGKSLFELPALSFGTIILR